MQKNSIICFFFINGIIYIFKKKSNKVKQTINLLFQILIIKVIKKLK